MAGAQHAASGVIALHRAGAVMGVPVTAVPPARLDTSWGSVSWVDALDGKGRTLLLTLVVLKVADAGESPSAAVHGRRFAC
jgi:hypothetical protein